MVGYASEKYAPFLVMSIPAFVSETLRTLLVKPLLATMEARFQPRGSRLRADHNTIPGVFPFLTYRSVGFQGCRFLEARAGQPRAFSAPDFLLRLAQLHLNG